MLWHTFAAYVIAVGLLIYAWRLAHSKALYEACASLKTVQTGLWAD